MPWVLPLVTLQILKMSQWSQHFTFTPVNLHIHDTVPASNRLAQLLLPKLPTAAAVRQPACVALQRNSWPQGWNDMARLLVGKTSSSGGVLGSSVNRQAGPALLLYPSSTGPWASGPGPPGTPGALNFSKLCPELLWGLSPQRNLHGDKTATISDTALTKKRESVTKVDAKNWWKACINETPKIMALYKDSSHQHDWPAPLPPTTVHETDLCSRL